MLPVVASCPSNRCLRARARAVLAVRCRRLGGRTVAQCSAGILTLLAATVIGGGIFRLATTTTFEQVWLEAPEPAGAASFEDALRQELASRSRAAAGVGGVGEVSGGRALAQGSTAR
ncbi:MAG: hypothetical protein IT373_02050 [Polyangiaceae bacterium]|nr:hypothetical protein [Polyangiaceae bacterium]